MRCQWIGPSGTKNGTGAGGCIWDTVILHNKYLQILLGPLLYLYKFPRSPRNWTVNGELFICDREDHVQFSSATDTDDDDDVTYAYLSLQSGRIRVRAPVTQ